MSYVPVVGKRRDSFSWETTRRAFASVAAEMPWIGATEDGLLVRNPWGRTHAENGCVWASEREDCSCAWCARRYQVQCFGLTVALSIGVTRVALVERLRAAVERARVSRIDDEESLNMLVTGEIFPGWKDELDVQWCRFLVSVAVPCVQRSLQQALEEEVQCWLPPPRRVSERALDMDGYGQIGESFVDEELSRWVGHCLRSIANMNGRGLEGAESFGLEAGHAENLGLFPWRATRVCTRE